MTQELKYFFNLLTAISCLSNWFCPSSAHQVAVPYMTQSVALSSWFMFSYLDGYRLNHLRGHLISAHHAIWCAEGKLNLFTAKTTNVGENYES